MPRLLEKLSADLVHTHVPGDIIGLSSGGLDLEAVQDAVAAMVIENYASTQRQGRFGSNGVAIYFPESKLAFDNDPDRDGYLPGNHHYPVEFVDRLRWAKFVRAYVDQVTY